MYMYPMYKIKKKNTSKLQTFSLVLSQILNDYNFSLCSTCARLNLLLLITAAYILLDFFFMLFVYFFLLL